MAWIIPTKFACMQLMFVEVSRGVMLTSALGVAIYYFSMTIILHTVKNS